MVNVAELLSRPLLRRDEPAWGSRVPWFAAFCGAAWALVAGLALCVLPAVVMWLSTGADGGTGEPLRLGTRVWLLGLGVGLDVGGVAYSLTPLGLTALVFVLTLRAARWAAHSAGVETSRRAVVVIVSMTATFVIGAGVAAGMAGAPGVEIVPLEAMTWAALWCGIAATAGVALESGLWGVWAAELPPSWRAAGAGAAAAVGAWAVGSAALVLVALVTHTDRTAALIGGLEAGAVGTGVLVVLSAIYVPTMIVWAGAFALGPGFAFGADTVVAPTGVDLGLVPALPLFGALPAGDLGVIGWLTLAVPVIVGVIGGVLVARRSPDVPRVARAIRAAGAGALAAVGMSAAAMLANGSLGAQRMADIGPVPWQLAAAAVVLVGAPAAVTAALLKDRAIEASPADELAETVTDPQT